MADNNSNVEKATYTAEEAAQVLGISIRKLYSLLKENPPFKIMRFGQRCIRIHKKSFDEWLDYMGDEEGEKS